VKIDGAPEVSKELGDSGKVGVFFSQGLWWAGVKEYVVPDASNRFRDERGEGPKAYLGGDVGTHS